MAGEAVVKRLREIHRAERKKSAAALPGTGSVFIRNPLGSNNVKYNTWFYGQKVHGDAFKWCCAYQSWAAAAANIPMTIVPKVASVLAMRDFFQKRNRMFQQPKVGDLVIFIFGPGARHIGFVEMVKPDGRFTTIEGNVSSRVMRVKHRVGEAGIAGFARPEYDKVPSQAMEDDDMPDEKTFKKWVREVVDEELDRRLKGGVIFGQENVGGTIATIADHVDKVLDEVRKP